MQSLPILENYIDIFDHNLSRSVAFFGIFLLLAPTLFVVRSSTGSPPWWFIVILVVIVGWFAYAVAVLSYFEHLWEVIERAKNPDPELVRRATADGAPKVFAIGFGWAFSIIYAVPWWLLYVLIIGLSGVRKSWTGR